MVYHKHLLFSTVNSDGKVIDIIHAFCYLKQTVIIVTFCRTGENSRRRSRPSVEEKGGRLTKKDQVSRKRALLCLNASLEKKAKDLVILKIMEMSDFADYFIICSGTSDRQVRAICTAIQENMKMAEILPLGIEGDAAGQWILMDYDDVIIHIFLESVRPFYDLEKLWSEAPRMAIADDAILLKALPRGL
jgi:ribosome-associated protein